MMFEDQPQWLRFIGAFGMPIVLVLVTLFIVWDRRRTKGGIGRPRPDTWRATSTASTSPTSQSPAEPARPYTVYTREFDIEIDAAEIPARLKGASPDQAKGWTDRHGIGWATALGLATQLARHERPIEDLAREFGPRIGDIAGDLAVTFLLDQSGSMRGGPIASTVVALTHVEAALSRIGATTEVLGFSTAGWQGGYARAQWLKNGRPKHPGRLCALLHIVYKSAAATEWLQQSREAMLYPDILRENIDGEALDWAAARLAAIPRPRKLLIMLSDGAPVDDSTLQQNAPEYLERDVLRAITMIGAREDISLGAIGIGYAVGRYYAHSRQSEIGSVSADLIALISDLAVQHPLATASIDTP
jgi:cobaltochelatase CobT